jgi:hypothetical protein
METNDHKEKLITYLYGEMSFEEKEEFEKVLEENPELSKDLDELRQMRDGLAGTADKEIMEPYYMWKNRSGWVLNRIINPRTTRFRYLSAIAASFLVLVLVGYLLKVDIRYQDKTLSISFFEGGENLGTAGLTEDQVKQIVQDEIARNNAILLTRLDDAEKSMMTKFASLESTSMQQLPASNLGHSDKEELERLLTRLNDQNLKALETYVVISNTQQQQNFQNILNSLSEYINYQRSEDMRLVNLGLKNLRETQEQQKRETDEVLANIITNVRYQNN